jgi:catechol 2,3-dioxygenase-like lactoylglutathione lyase family enzyme
MHDAEGPFGRFFQIGYVTRNVREACATLTRRMGARRIDLIEDLRDADGREVMIRSLSHLSLGDVEIELIEPRTDWPSIYLDALPPEGDATPALHHLGYRLPDIESWDAAMQALRGAGMAVALEGAPPRVRFAYLDTRDEIGHYTEVVYRGYD